MTELLVILIYVSFALDFVVFPIPSEASTVAMTRHTRAHFGQRTVFLWIAHATILLTWIIPLVFALMYALTTEQRSASTLVYTGILLAIIGRAITISTSVTLTSFRTSTPHSSILTTGLFALSRHPIVLGLHLSLAGLLLSTEVLGLAIPYLFTIWYFDYKLGVEERQLQITHGDKYHAYMQKTGRYLSWPWKK